MRFTIDTRGVRGCSFPGCYRRPINRHHKGNDAYLGYFHPGIRARYYQWLDCAEVCEYHHKRIHYLYNKKIEKWQDRTPSGALKFRAELIAYCDKIIAGEIKLRKPTKHFLAEWRASKRRWKSRQQKPNQSSSRTSVKPGTGSAPT